MIRKCHNHKPQTNRWHREEKPLNHHETPGLFNPCHTENVVPPTLTVLTCKINIPQKFMSYFLFLKDVACSSFGDTYFMIASNAIVSLFMRGSRKCC